MSTYDGRVAASSNNNIIGFDLDFVHKQYTQDAKPNLIKNMGNVSIPAISSKYAFYSANTESGFVVEVYDQQWRLQFNKKWYNEFQMINFAAGEYHLEEGTFATFAVFYITNEMRVGEIYEEYPKGVFTKVKELLPDCEVWANKVAINDNYLIISYQKNDIFSEKIFWRGNKKGNAYSFIKDITNENVEMERILIKQNHFIVAFKSYTVIYKTNRDLGSVIKMSEINENVLDISMYDGFDLGYLIYLDDLFIPNVCTWDIANSDCEQIATFYPTDYRKDTLAVFDKYSGNFIVSQDTTLYLSTFCSPNSIRKTLNDTVVCENCKPGKTNSGYATQCYSCYYKTPKWSIYGPHPGCGWQCLFGNETNSSKCIPMERSFIFWSSLITMITVFSALFVVPIMFCTCASFSIFVFILSFLFFGIFVSLPTFGWHLFDFIIDQNHNYSIYDAFFLRLLMLGIPSFFAIILLITFSISCHITKKTGNPKYGNSKNYPPTKIFSFMCLGMIVAIMPGFLISMFEFVKTGVNPWSISILYQGIFWYFIPLLIGITSFSVTTCLWFSDRRAKDFKEIGYQQLSVNNVEVFPLLCNDEDIPSNLSQQTVTVISNQRVCTNCGGGGKISDQNEIFNCYYCKGRGIIENI